MERKIVRFSQTKSYCFEKFKDLCCVGKEIFNLKCLLIEFLIPNLNQFYFRIQEIFKMSVYNRFLSSKSPLEFVFSCCEFVAKNWYEMFV